MTPHDLLANFEVLAEAPNGIQRLRELVLELAVRGKLVERKRTEWATCRLDEVGDWAIGAGFPTALQGRSDEEFCFCKVSDMNLPGNNKFIVQTNHTVSAQDLQKLRAKAHPLGTVIFPKIGGAIATNKRRVLTRPTAIDNNCLGVIPRLGVLSEWLFLVLQSIDLSKYQSGTSVPALAQGVIGAISVCVPSPEDQQETIRRVDELMVLLDRLEAKRQDRETARTAARDSALAALREAPTPDDVETAWLRIQERFHELFATPEDVEPLRQAILQLAVWGRLVNQDPSEESAQYLFDSIDRVRKQRAAAGEIKKGKIYPPVSTTEIPYQLPKEWILARLDQVFDVRDGTHDTPKYVPEGIPLVTSKNLSSGRLQIDGSKQISLEDHLEISKRSKVDIGDILFAMIGTIGNPVIVDTCHEFSIKNMALFKPIASRLNNMEYLLAFLRAASGSMNEVAGGGVQKFVSLGFLREHPFPLPPQEEQMRILRNLNRLLYICDQLESALQIGSSLRMAFSAAAVHHLES